MPQHSLLAGAFLLLLTANSLSAAFTVSADPVGEQPLMATFRVRLDAPATSSQTFCYTTVSDTAVEGVDFEAKTGTVSLSAGVTEAIVRVPLIDDGEPGGDETFALAVWPEGGSPVAAEESFPLASPPGAADVLGSALALSDGRLMIEQSDGATARKTLIMGRFEGGGWVEHQRIAVGNAPNSLSGGRLLSSATGSGARTLYGLSASGNWEWLQTLPTGRNGSSGVRSYLSDGKVLWTDTVAGLRVGQIFESAGFTSLRPLAAVAVTNASDDEPSELSGRNLAVASLMPGVILLSAEGPGPAWTQSATLVPGGGFSLDGNELATLQSDGSATLRRRSAELPHTWPKVATLPAPTGVPAQPWTARFLVKRGGLALRCLRSPVKRPVLMPYLREPGGTWLEGAPLVSGQLPFAQSAEHPVGFAPVAMAGLHAAVALENPARIVTLRFNGAAVRLREARPVRAEVLDCAVTEPRGAASVAVDVPVRLSREVTTAVSLPWSVVSGTATPGVDVVPASGVLHLPARSSAGVITLTVVGDGLPEPTEQCSVVLGPVPGVDVVGGTLTIHDDSVSGAAWVSPTTARAYEDAMPATLSLEIVSGGGSVAVPWQATTVASSASLDPSLASPADFLPLAGTGLTSSALEVPLVLQPSSDSAREPEESLVVSLPAAAGVSIPPEGTVCRIPTAEDGTQGDPPSTGSTDGEHAVISHGGSLRFFHRSVGGVWASVGTLAGAGSPWLRLRAGRLLAVAGGGTSAEVLEPDGQGLWKRVATLWSVPPEAAAAAPIHFDGRSVGVSLHGTNHVFVRSQSGWHLAGVESGTRMTSLDRGLITGVREGALRQFRLGGGTTPWEEVGVVVPGLDPSRVEPVAGDALWVDGTLHRRGADGAWAAEQAIEASPSGPLGAVAPGVIWDGGNAFWLDSGRSPNRWRRVVSDLTEGDRLLDGENGVALVRRGDAVLIRERGRDVVIVDDDSFEPRLVLGDVTEPPVGSETFPAAVRVEIPPLPFAVRYRVSSSTAGSATPGVDFAAMDQLVTLPAGQTTFTLPLTVFADREYDPEILALTLSEPSWGGVPTGPVLANIADPPVVITAPAALSLPEPQGASRRHWIAFKLPHSFPTPQTFSVIVTPLAATEGSDFRLVSPTVTVQPGRRQFAVAFDVMGDDLPEVEEKFTLGLAPQPGFTAPPPTVVTLTDRPSLLSEDAFTAFQGGVFTAPAAQGVLADDAEPAPAVVKTVVGAGALSLDADGALSWAPPSPNFVGTTGFSYNVQIIGPTATWKWLHPLNGVSPAAGDGQFSATWSSPSFDDAAWSLGQGQFGYGGLGVGNAVAVDTDLGTPTAGRHYAAYFRRAFDCTAGGASQLEITFSCDDGVLFWLNGANVGRFGVNPLIVPDDVHKLAAVRIAEGGEEVEMRTLVLPVTLLRGRNVLGISLHNQHASSGDLGLRVHSVSVGPPQAGPVWATLTATDGNRPPVVASDAFETEENEVLDTYAASAGGAYENDLLWDDFGEAFDPILGAVITPPTHGTVSFEAQTGHFRYTPQANWFGPDAFTYRVQDKDGLSNVATVSVRVRGAAGFRRYQSEMYGTSPDDPRLAPDADPDGDGVPNLLEYATGRSASAPTDGEVIHVSPRASGVALSLGLRSPLFLARVAVESSTALTGPWETIAALDDGLPLELASGVDGRIESGVLELDDRRPRVVARYYRLRVVR